jgi:GDPmannose 4,6-dehydratase
MKKSLILGVLGQDGYFLSELLNSEGYEVHGVLRKNIEEEKKYKIKQKFPWINLHEIDLLNFEECRDLFLKINPDEIYNFTGITNIFKPFQNLDILIDNTIKIPCNFLKLIVDVKKETKFFQSSSCLIFENNDQIIKNENSTKNPQTPYGVAKNFVDQIIKLYRDEYNIFACSGIFFNHESERRGKDFFTQKVVEGAIEIKKGIRKKLFLGNLSIKKDIGYARDYMEATYLMMQNQTPKDYVIGTGDLVKLENFVKIVFDYLDLDYTLYVCFDEKLDRKKLEYSMVADTTNIYKDLYWKPKTDLNKLIKNMIENYERVV